MPSDFWFNALWLPALSYANLLFLIEVSVFNLRPLVQEQKGVKLRPGKLTVWHETTPRVKTWRLRPSEQSGGTSVSCSLVSADQVRRREKKTKLASMLRK